jgi:hypothetical protein
MASIDLPYGESRAIRGNARAGCPQADEHLPEALEVLELVELPALEPLVAPDLLPKLEAERLGRASSTLLVLDHSALPPRIRLPLGRHAQPGAGAFGARELREQIDDTAPPSIDGLAIAPDPPKQVQQYQQRRIRPFVRCDEGR